MALVRILVALCTVALLAPAATAEMIDAVVATVDKEVILHSDIMTEIRPLVPEDGSGGQDTEAIYDAALEQAIEQKILYREGLLNDIKITDEQVEERIKRYRDQYDTEDAFLAALTEAGETMSDFRERVRKQTVALSMGLSKRHYLEKEVVVSEADLAQYYQDHIDDFQKPERVKLYRIFIGMEEGEASRAKALARMEALKEELALGADFSKLAMNHSEGPDAAQGGFVGWVERGELIPELEEVAFSLNPGDISPIIEITHGLMLLKSEEKVDAGLAPYEEARGEIEPVLRQAGADGKYQKWMSELRKRSRVRTYR